MYGSQRQCFFDLSLPHCCQCWNFSLKYVLKYFFWLCWAEGFFGASGPNFNISLSGKKLTAISIYFWVSWISMFSTFFLQLKYENKTMFQFLCFLSDIWWFCSRITDASFGFRIHSGYVFFVVKTFFTIILRYFSRHFKSALHSFMQFWLFHARRQF